MSDKLLELRHSYRACIKLANETDSKKEDLKLRAEAAEYLKQLQNQCNHEIVVSTDLYSTYNYEYSEEDCCILKKCIFCGITEWMDHGFSLILKNKSSASYYNKHNRPVQIENPLNYLVSEIKEVIENNKKPLKIILK